MDKEYDIILEKELEKKLNRKPSSSEIINADTDSNLVNECLWQLIKELDARVKLLEKK
mgnify:CR=1 FL=1